MRRRFFRSSRIWVVSIVALLAVAIYVLRAPMRQAAKIQRRDSAAAVHERLGNPEAIFNTTLELRESYLGPMSFVFSDTSGQKSDLSVDQLPDVKTRAEWFEYGYGSAGHLVYYDDIGVIDIFWGGT